MNDISVLGIFVADISFSGPKIPSIGETILGNNYNIGPGGKGCNQAIAIARATAFNSKLVIMDEPTAALAIKEVGKVLDLINGLKKIGVSVIIISHRMDDIFAVCDRVTALFQGTNFAEAELSKTSRDEVIGWIMGKK